MVKFLTEQDIEQAASQGATEIALDANTRVTDLARDAAQRLGVRFVQSGERKSSSAPDSAPAQPAQSDLHQQVRAAIVSQLGMAPDGLDAIIDRVLKAEGQG